MHFSSASLNLLLRREQTMTSREPYWTTRDSKSTAQPLTKRVPLLKPSLYPRNPGDPMALERFSIENGSPVVVLRNRHFKTILRRLHDSSNSSVDLKPFMLKTTDNTPMIRRSYSPPKARPVLETSPSFPIIINRIM